MCSMTKQKVKAGTHALKFPQGEWGNSLKKPDKDVSCVQNGSLYLI